MKKLLRAAAVLTLLALALMVWSVLQPTPLPVMLAMSLGQALGTGAFAMFGLAILIDLRRSRRIRRESRQPPLASLREVLAPPEHESPEVSLRIPVLRELLTPPAREAPEDPSGELPAIEAPAPAPAAAPAPVADPETVPTTDRSEDKA